MADRIIICPTELPEDIIKTIETDLKKFDADLEESTVSFDRVVDGSLRNSQNAWIPTTHWLGGFIWYYAQRANRENFLYDLTTIDNETMQYTVYNEGCYYGWHTDAAIDCSYRPQTIVGTGKNKILDDTTVQSEYIRKLSFSLQLSDENDYEGGELQFTTVYNESFFAPKKRGTLIFFDSRTPHRVRKVKKGVRKSLVGWVIGPRWK